MIIDGKKVRDEKREVLASRIASCPERPHLTIISVGTRPDSETYINAKKIYGESIGVTVTRIQLSENASEEDVCAVIKEANNDSGVHGIICQLPLPAHIRRAIVVDSIAPHKDVDALSSFHTIRLLRGDTQFLPATTRGIMTLLAVHNISVASRHVVVVGRSDLVGKPTALTLLAHNATVTIAHSQTHNLASITREADIVISVTGIKDLITPEHVRKEQVIIDVGINKDGEDVIHGDVSFDDVHTIVDAITPVPGGVGPMTVHSLFENLLDLVEKKVVL